MERRYDFCNGCRNCCVLHAYHRSGRLLDLLLPLNSRYNLLPIFACLRFSLHTDFSDSCICCWHLHYASLKAGLESGVCALVMFLCANIQLPVHDAFNSSLIQSLSVISNYFWLYIIYLMFSRV